jgi:glycosyltransferase involved in cell wall biosynthesis
MTAPPRRRFLVVVHPYPPTPSSGANRWAAMVKYLRRAGHDVRVATSAAFGVLADPDEERGVVRTADLMASARLRRAVGLPPLAPPDGAAAAAAAIEGRAAAAAGLPRPLTHLVVPDPFLLSWAPMALRAAWRELRRAPVDCVVTSSPNESTHLVGLALRRRFGHAWIADLRDGWTFERFLPDFPTRGQRALNRELERRTLSAADGVTAATRPIADDLRLRYGLAAEHVSNAWDPDLEEGLAVAPEAALDGRIELVHTGAISGAWGRDPAPLFRALRRLLAEEPALRPRLRLVIAGRLPGEELDRIRATGLGESVEHVGHLPRADALRLQRGAGALVLVTSGNSGEATGKLFEYLAADRPILALAAANEAARIVGETGTGLAVDPAREDDVLAGLRAAAHGELPYAPRGLDAYRYPGPALRVAALAERAIAARGERA